MSTIIEEKSVKGLHEIALFSFIAVAIFYLLSLLTFSHQDAGWSHSGSNIVMRNAGGLVGAWLADFSFSFFGVIAFSFPLIIFWQGYLFFSRKNKRNTTGFMQAMRWLGLIVAIISASTFCYLHIFRCPIELPRNSGGIIGQELGEVAIVTFGNSGATLLLIAVFFSSITLYTHISWLRLMETVGKNTLFFISLCYKKLTLLLDEVKTKRAENREVFEPVNIRLTQKPATKIKTILPVNFTEIKEEVIPVPSVITKNTKIDLCKDIEPKAIPDTKLLDLRIVSIQGYSANELEYMSRLVEQSLQDFNVIAEVTDVLPGPVIIRFEMQPAAGVKVSRISSLAKDLARSLSVTSVRIVEIIAGKSVIGLEIPNQQREMVSFRKGLESTEFIKSKSPLSLFLGKDIAGMPMVADLAKMPHLLVAGTTGSGKSVAVNTMIMSILYKATPSDVKMIMIDPKMLELSVYEGIPHLLTPVVTDMKDAANALRWAVAEMERRYKLMSKVGVRNLSGFNRLVSEAEKKGDPLKDPMYSDETDLAEGESIPTLSTIPNIVIVIDELADMMMIVGKKVEELIARLAQKARAAGIHLILATQRPSVDVLTGLIKANIPSRISFQVSSRIDSRTVLDQGGAEFLLGNGDMLFMPSGVNIPIRVHGAFVDDHEVHHVVEFLKKTAPANYLQDITQEHSESNDGSFSTGQEAIDAEKDDLYDQAVAFVTESRKASISSVQRRFKVGYNRAATMIEAMEMAEIISPAEGSGSRQVLAPAPVR